MPADVPWVTPKPGLADPRRFVVRFRIVTSHTSFQDQMEGKEGEGRERGVSS